MKFKLLTSLVFLIFVTGCVQHSTPIAIQPVITEKPPTLTRPSPITTAENTDTSALLTKWEISKNCTDIYPTRLQGYELSGVVPIRSLSSTVLGLNMSLLNLNTGTTKEIDTANQSVWDADISPNRVTLAYTWFNTNTSRYELTLIDALGDHQKAAWSSDNDFGFTGWLNNEQLIVPQISSYLIVNSNNGSLEEISPLGFPDFVVYNQTHFYVSFDPFLTRAIYKDGDIILSDINTKTIITRISDGYDRIPIIAWQTSGKQVAVIASTHIEESYGLSDEIFIAKQNGQFEQLTHLHESFGQAFTINSLSWSPNEDKIAFWLFGVQAEQTLIVADALTGEITNYCISNVLSDLFPIDVSAPIWSPDGKQLLVENRYTQDKSNLLIVDLSKNIAFPVAENANPVGWMITP